MIASRFKIALLLLFVAPWSARAVMTLEDDRPLIGKVRWQVNPLRFGGPQLMMAEGIKEWPVIPISEKSEELLRTVDPDSLKADGKKRHFHQNRFLIKLEGTAEGAQRLIFDGREVHLHQREWSTEAIVQTGNNEFPVFLYDANGKFSNYMVDIQLLDYREPHGTYFVEPLIVKQKEIPRPTGLVLDVGATYGTFSLENLEGDVLNSVLDMNLYMRADYWLGKLSSITSDLALHASVLYHVNYFDGNVVRPTITLAKIGSVLRYFFLDEFTSPWVWAGGGGFLYDFNDSITTEERAMGIYVEAGFEIPILTWFGFFGRGLYGLVPRSGDLTRMIEYGGGVYFAFSDSMRVNITALIRNYNVYDIPNDVTLTHSFYTFIGSTQIDL